MNDNEIQLCNIDPDDIDDAIKTVENEFGFKFIQSDVDGVYNFGQFCDMVVLKINFSKTKENHQGFYQEVESEIKRIFMTSLYIPERALTRDATFN